MDRLWSPWRSAYVSGQAERGDGCLFCRFASDQDDSANLVLYRGRDAYALLNRFPYNPGHLMILPYQHIADFEALPTDTVTAMMQLLNRALRALREVYRPDGFNVGMNLGAAAGAGIAEHLHMHVVPRWSGDTNFMPTTADVKVMPQRLEEAYTDLARAMADSAGR